MKAKFYFCRRCGNLAGMIHDAGVPMTCCGQKMEVLDPNTVDASQEKHVPQVTVADGAIHVNVGAVNHPMEEEHFIQWVYVKTENGGHYRALKPGDEPCAVFLLGQEKPVAAYEYCNLHGLWMTKV